MFDILRNSLSVGVVTTSYPATVAEISRRARGRPEIDFANWKDARPATTVCPTGAIAFADQDGQRTASLDLGRCVFCGLCAEADTAIRMTNRCELASRRRNHLVFAATYRLNPDGAHQAFLESPAARGSVLPDEASTRCSQGSAPAEAEGAEAAHRESVGELGRGLEQRIHAVLGRSLHIREVDAGSCNGCEVEIHCLNSPVLRP